jgi:hypothetical protein
MKKQICLLALIGVLLLSAAPAWAQGDFFVIAGGGPPVGTKITYLPYTIPSDKPGFYYLAGNLTYSSTNGVAIDIFADNVILDLMGYTLSGPGSSSNTDGIWIYGCNNVEVRNGTIRGFESGLLADFTGNGHRAINIRAINNHWGVEFDGIDNLIKDCDGSNNDNSGLVLTQSGIISDCVACNNKWGIVAWGPATVLRNAAFSNSTYNFDLGIGVATAILVDRNSAFGTPPINYYIESDTTGVQMGTNAGTP